MAKILQYTTTVTNDAGISIPSTFIYPEISVENILTDGTIDIDYKCYTTEANKTNDNIKPFKLLNSSSERVKSIEGYTPGQPISETNYADIAKDAFVATFGWDANDVSIVTES